MHHTRHLIIVNGLPRAGKDTAVECMRRALARYGYLTEMFSSIDPVRDMLRAAGFDLSAKTDADRDMLAEVGDAVEKHSEFRTNACVTATLKFFDTFDNASTVMFIHMREPALIQRLRAKMSEKVITVLVESSRGKLVLSNAADSGVYEMSYDSKISNHGTLEDLQRHCEAFLYKHRLIDEVSLLPC